MAYANFEALAVVILASLAIELIPSVLTKIIAAALLNSICLDIVLKFAFVVILGI